MSAKRTWQQLLAAIRSGITTKAGGGKVVPFSNSVKPRKLKIPGTHEQIVRYVRKTAEEDALVD